MKDEHQTSPGILPLHSTIKDVVDLLKDLPDGNLSSLKRIKSTSTKITSKNSPDFNQLSHKHPETPKEFRSDFQIPLNTFQNASESFSPLSLERVDNFHKDITF